MPGRCLGKNIGGPNQGGIVGYHANWCHNLLSMKTGECKRNRPCISTNRLFSVVLAFPCKSHSPESHEHIGAILGPGRAGLGSLFPEARHRHGLRPFNAFVPSQAFTGTWLCMVCSTVRDFRLLVFQLKEARLFWFLFWGYFEQARQIS